MEWIKKFIWPINRGEYKKFIPMLLIFFLISFSYNLLRISKDTLIITAPGSGAETIPFIKVWVMLPSAILMTYIFTKISNKHARDKVFYTMIIIFISFFTIFTFILYPLRDSIHLYNFANKLENILPIGMHGLISLMKHWTYTLYYVMSELWGTIILTVLFWGFANEVTSITEAKRFYALFAVGANIASIIAGQATVMLSKNTFYSYIHFGTTPWDQSVLFINSFVIIIGILMILIFYYLNKSIPQTEEEKRFKTKNKQSLRKNFSYLKKSKYLISIAIMVMCYNIAINLVEVIWKNQVKTLYPNATDFNAYMGKVVILMGILSTIIALFISGNFLRKFNWTFNALITPIIVLITGASFFFFFLIKGTGALSISSFFGSSPLVLSVMFGMVHNCMTRASKYTLFDTTKEISYIPLNKEDKLKGKAAIDGIGSRIGKSTGSIIHQGMLILFSSIAATASYISGIFFVIVVIWIITVKSLGKQFSKLTTEKDVPATDEKETAEVT